METSGLTFKSLDERIEKAPEHPSERASLSRCTKWGIALIAVAGTLGLVLGKLLPPRPWVAILLSILFVLESAGIVLTLSANVASFKLTFAHQRREFAEVLDFDMPHHASLIAWLRSFPGERLQAMSDFSAFRIERYRSKMPALTGAIEKLGALPVLAALVIQLKDVSWPLQLSWWQVSIFAVLIFFYWLCLLAVSQRFRLELYGMLLKKALAPD